MQEWLCPHQAVAVERVMTVAGVAWAREEVTWGAQVVVGWLAVLCGGTQRHHEHPV